MDAAVPAGSDPFELLHKLHAKTDVPVPPRMLALETMPVLHTSVIKASEMEETVKNNLL